MTKVNFSKNIYDFCIKNAINAKQLKRLKNDASKRIYYRISNYKKKSLLMDSSAEKRSLKKFIIISDWLKKNNLSSPNIYLKDINSGLLVIEDFGDFKYSILCKKEKEKKEYYYKQAIKLLVSLSYKKKPKFIKNYDNKILKNELNLYLKWYLRIYDNKKACKEWSKIWNYLLNKINYTQSCLVLRDFHVDNIFYLKNKKREKKIGLIDYQDSLIGHPAYDLVSLLQDVRVFLSREKQLNYFNYFLKYKKMNYNEFKYAYLVLGTQRLFKIIGIFNKLAKERGKKNYLKYLPRTKILLKNNLNDTIFNELNSWLEKYTKDAKI